MILNQLPTIASWVPSTAQGVGPAMILNQLPTIASWVPSTAQGVGAR